MSRRFGISCADLETGVFDVFVDVSGSMKARRISSTKSRYFWLSFSHAEWSRAMCLIRVQTMKMTSWWHNVCLFLVCAISRETSTEMDVQTVNVIVFFFFFFYNNMVYTLIDHRNDVKTFKTLQWNHSPGACGSIWVLNLLTSFL